MKKSSRPKPGPSTKMRQYVLDCIDEEDDDGKPLARAEDKVKYMLDRFQAEYNCAWNIKTYPQPNARIASWLQGLGGPISLDYLYVDIIERGKGFGYRMLTEKAEGVFCESWWTKCAHALIMLANEHGIPIPDTPNNPEMIRRVPRT